MSMTFTNKQLFFYCASFILFHITCNHPFEPDCNVLLYLLKCNMKFFLSMVNPTAPNQGLYPQSSYVDKGENIAWLKLSDTIFCF